MPPHRLGVIGLGKIAQDQHLPVIADNPAFRLTAVASRRGVAPDGVDHALTEYGELILLDDVDAVAICTPPDIRHRLARAALAAGKHVMLEKPPTASIGELADLEQLAAHRGLVLFTTWHSQYNDAVEKARELLADRAVSRLTVTWKEDVQRWHPGQQWIWEPGGFGVFDPGINALSIVTAIVPEPVFVTAAELKVPENRDTPIAAALTLANGSGGDLSAVFDWRQQGDEVWEIGIETANGDAMLLSHGGRRLVVNETEAVDRPSREYHRIYERFDRLLADGTALVDAAPLALVADAFLVGRRVAVEPFHE